MSESTAPEQAPEEHHGDGGHEHPSDRAYIWVAAILAILTAAEIGLFYGEFGQITVPALIVLTIGKFVLVALWFMHLRFDHKVLNRLFLIGLVLAGLIYAVVVVLFLV